MVTKDLVILCIKYLIMKNIFHFLLVSILLIAGCDKRKVKLTEEKKTESNVSTFWELAEFQYDGKKLILTKEELLQQFGEPDTIYSGGAFQPDKFIKSGSQTSSTLIHYENYFYGPLKFAVWDSKAQISFINFTEFTDTIYYHKINLSNGTSIDEIKKKFPTVYDSKNYEMNSFFGLNPEKYGFKKEDVDWLQFRNGSKESHSKIELTFLSGDLIWAYFEVSE